MTFWGVPRSAVPAALCRMALDRRHLRRAPGLQFAKLLGTGDGRTFTVRDADPCRWGLLATWDSEQAADDFTHGVTHRRWQDLATERLHLALRPLASRGRWAGREPFGDPRPRRTDGVVAAVTRARIRVTKARAFWRSVPPVSTDLRDSDGLLLAVGIGEAPVGLQGTFSLWSSGAALTEFAHRRAPHLEAVARTAREGWYAEELFARFELVSAHGRFAGVRLDASGTAAGP
jgi:hypothetical protein